MLLILVIVLFLLMLIILFILFMLLMLILLMLILLLLILLLLLYELLPIVCDNSHRGRNLCEIVYQTISPNIILLPLFAWASARVPIIRTHARTYIIRYARKCCLTFIYIYIYIYISPVCYLESV